MILDEQKVKILTELAKINSQVWFTSDTLSFVDNAGTIAAMYDWGIKLEKEEGFGIADLATLLSLLKLYKNTPTIIEGDTELVIAEGSKKIHYRYVVEKSCINQPKNKAHYEKAMGNPEMEIDISSELLSDIKINASILKTPHIVFEGNKITAMDIDLVNENSFVYELPENIKLPRIAIFTENIAKIINGNYKFSTNGILAKFVDSNNILTVYTVGAAKKEQ